MAVRRVVPVSGWYVLVRGRRPAGDSGNAPLELVILSPIVLFLIGLVIAAGRIYMAQGAVQTAADAAARQASISLSESAARQSATASALAALAGDGLACQPSVRLDLSGFTVAPGLPAKVSATVTCTVRLSDLLVPGVPGRRTLRAHFASPLDPYRARALAGHDPRRHVHLAPPGRRG